MGKEEEKKDQQRLRDQTVKRVDDECLSTFK
jgi:hypothetical protein